MRIGRRFFHGCQVHASALGVVGASLLAAAVWPACQLNHPAPVTPDYPPEPPFTSTATDAGKGEGGK